MELPRKVFVFILPTFSNVSRSSLIIRLFSDPLFEIIGTDDSEINMNYVEGMNSNSIREAELIKCYLRKSSELDPDAPCIIIRDTSVSDASPNTISDIVKRSLRFDFDLCYLCKWLDLCQLYTRIDKEPVEVIKNQKITLMETRSPQGTQAILYSKYGRDIILGRLPMKNGSLFIVNRSMEEKLNSEIFIGNIKAICTVPNLINYDIVLNAMSNSDYLKLDECLPVSENKKSQSSDSANFLWLIAIIVLAIIVGWAAIKLGPRN
jgi:hypothetical protein